MDSTQNTAAQSGPSLGKPLDRVDGRLKVTGSARYAADMPVADVVYGALIMSTASPGRITAVDDAAARKLPGVIEIITPVNAMRLPAPVSGPPGPGGAGARPPQRHTGTLQEMDVLYQNQPIGVAIADTFERAVHAASLVTVIFETTKPRVDMDAEKANAYAPGRGGAGSARGDMDTGLSAASAKVTETYITPVETHNPMEPHATLAVWDSDDHLTVYDATQGVFNDRSSLARAFGLQADNVRVVCHFVGGGFGCKGSTWSHVIIAALAAKQVGRPVKLALERRQMFGPVGFRPRTVQDLRLGATGDGALTAVGHDVHSHTSSFDEFLERAAGATQMLYDTPNIATSHSLVRLDLGTPTYMRGPGEASGTFAIESAMDELSYALKMDPIELRLKNYAEKDPESGKPWSSKSLRECYHAGAEKFGWARRTAAPRSMRAPDGRLLGWGMATATYPAGRGQSSALARLLPDGTAYAQAGTQDLGTGTYTVMTQTVADALGLPPNKVLFELGDTRMPMTPVSGGSQTASSTGSAVYAAGLAARDKAIALAVADPASPLTGLAPTDVVVQDGRMFSKSDPTKGETYTALMARQKLPLIEVTTSARPDAAAQQYAMHSFGAIFAEVAVDPDLGQIRAQRIVGAYGVGNIMNAKTARSQMVGGVIFGLGMTLLEETLHDPRSGRVMNADLAEYHIPVNADMPAIDIIFVPETDTHINPLGVKGIGEIGNTGVSAALANAVYHATGKRVRDLPITLDKVL